VRPWHQPWNAEHAAGKITRPLHFNSTPYSDINVIMLWSEAVSRGYSAPIWMTWRARPQGRARHVRGLRLDLQALRA
jgi:antirestriction protein ArdC